MAANPPGEPGGLNQPNIDGKAKAPQLKEKANLDDKTKAVFLKKGYEVEYKISAGAFGQVYTVRNEKRGATEAVKVMDLPQLTTRFKEKFLMREIMALAKIKHPNVIRVNDIFKSRGRIYIFMEYAGGGTLSDQIRKSDGGYLREERARFWFRQVADALQAMHVVYRICHRDIKVENVLLDDKLNAKLSDFGFTRELSPTDNLSTTYCGTEPYFAPELVQREKYDPFAVDIWAMGVMLFAMVNGKFPFHWRDLRKDKNIMLNEQRSRAYKFRPEVDVVLSVDCKDIIAKMLSFDVSARPTIDQLLQQPWMQQVPDVLPQN